MDAIRTAALAAVAEVSATHEDQGTVLWATRIVREKTGCRLADARDAVLWAIERPAAATLPFGTVVAAIGGAFFKEEESTVSRYPWAATHVSRQTSDVDIDDLLRSDRAEILRVGTGEGS